MPNTIESNCNIRIYRSRLLREKFIEKHTTIINTYAYAYVYISISHAKIENDFVSKYLYICIYSYIYFAQQFTLLRISWLFLAQKIEKFLQ